MSMLHVFIPWTEIPGHEVHVNEVEGNQLVIHGLFIKVFRTPEEVTNEHVEAYHKALKFIEDQLKARGTKFLGGSLPGFADYMIWPWFERIVFFDLDERLNIDGQKYKLLSEYINNMLKDPAVSQYNVPKDIMNKFISQYRTGPRF